MTALDVCMIVLFLFFLAACYLTYGPSRAIRPPGTREEIRAEIEAEYDACWKRSVDQVAARREHEETG